jgi:hypothetical protein
VAADQLQAIVRACPWMMSVLRAARVCAPSDWWVGGGVLRDLVWDRLHGDFDPARVKDVDLAFYDPLDAADGVATWPETATAVAVRLCVDDSLEVLAPCGVADLLGGVCRRNPLESSRGGMAADRLDHQGREGTWRTPVCVGWRQYEQIR